MEFCLSFWSGGYYKEISPYLVDVHRLCVNLILKHYGKCRLITDSHSKSFFEDVGFTEITTELDCLSPSVNWALGKLHAYKVMASEGKPFCHVDYDVFLWKPLPEELLTSPVFCQSVENKVYDLYAFSMFEKHHVNRHFVVDTARRNYQRSYNVGIFGGSDLSFIKKYAEQSIAFSIDKENEKCYKIMAECQPQSVPCISEQYSLFTLCKKYEMPMSCLLKHLPEDPEDVFEKEACSKGYTHLAGHKSHPMVKQSIYLKLYELGLKEIL